MIRHFVWDYLRRHSSHQARRWLKERSWFTFLTKVLFRHTVYSQSYYADIVRLESASTEVMANWITQHLKPASIIDVGCGPGLLMDALHQRGVAVLGVDVSQESQRILSSKGLPFQYFNLTQAGRRLPGGPYDLAISCEVAEHLEPRYAKEFVHRLTEAASRVYLTAAEPRPGVAPGLHHFNEQPNEYWIGLMRQEGFELDEQLTSAARETFAGQNVICYLARPMIFVQKHLPAG